MNDIMALSQYADESARLIEREMEALAEIVEQRPHRTQFFDVLRRTSSDTLRKWLGILKGEETLGSERPGHHERAAVAYHIECIGEVLEERNRQ